LSDSELLDEIVPLDDLIFKIIGKRPAHFRPPYGDYNDNVLRIVGKAGHRYADLWTTDSNDWSNRSKDASFKNIEKSNPKGIILSHDWVDSNIALAKKVIETYHGSYTFVTMAECVGDANAGYQ
jgi:peptidoglycan/xylan/chitin deacetylase (PgdA/CDA1 family)